jgi:hypothetical protein
MKINSFLLYIFLSFLIFTSGCKKKKATSTATSVTTTSESVNPIIGVVDDAKGFYIQPMLNNGVNYKIHGASSGGFSAENSFDLSQKCRILQSATSKDLMCFIEAAELDLYYHGIELVYNFPSDMCSYAEVIMPWFFQYPVVDFSGVNVHRSVDNSITPTIVTDIENSCLNGKDYCAFNFNQWTSAKEKTANSITNCRLNTSPNLEPNCCLGTYTIIEDNISSSGTTTSTNVSEWGGNITSCLAGPGLDLQLKSGKMFPTSDLYYIKDVGKNNSTIIPAPFIKELRSNLYLANFFYSTNYNDSSTYPASFNTAKHTKLNTSASMNVLKSPGSSSGTYTLYSKIGVPFYEYRCYDNAQEVIARIRVLIRSWHTKINFDTLPTSYSSPVNYLTGLTHESAPFNNFFFEDHLIWDQIFPVITQASSPSIVNGLSYSTDKGFLMGFPGDEL